MILPLVLAAGLLLGQTDAGYVREQTSDGAHCLRWPVAAGSTSQVTFVQSSAGDFKLGAGLFDAVSRSEASWAAQASSCSSLRLLEGAHSPSRAIGYDPARTNENLILVRTTDCMFAVPSGDPCRTTDTCGNVYDCWDHGAALLALTLLTFDENGTLLDTDVEINGAISYLSLVDSPPCTPGNVTSSCVGNDAQNTVTHELGHALGLGHSPDPSSTMYSIAPLGETSKRVLDPASKQFVCDVYAPGLASRDCLLPDGGTDPGTGGGSGGGGGTAGGPTVPVGPGIARTASGCAAVDGAGAPGVLLAALSLAALATRRPRARR
jgi:Matrixin